MAAEIRLPQTCKARDRFEIHNAGTQYVYKLHVTFRQLAREKSLVPERSEIRGNSPHNSKGIFEDDVSQFESSRPSQLSY